MYQLQTGECVLSIHRFIYEPVQSNMYCIIQGKQAILIDPNKSQLALQLLKDNHVEHIVVLLTHEHFDHTSGVNWYASFFEHELLCHSYCAERIADSKNNRPLLVARVVKDQNGKNGKDKVREALKDYEPYACKASKQFDKQLEFIWQGYSVKMISTPGHTPGSCCILLGEKCIFTGDSWIKNTPVITRFPGGSKEAYDNYTKPLLMRLGEQKVIMPGHGEAFCYKDGKECAINEECIL